MQAPENPFGIRDPHLRQLDRKLFGLPVKFHQHVASADGLVGGEVDRLNLAGGRRKQGGRQGRARIAHCLDPNAFDPVGHRLNQDSGRAVSLAVRGGGLGRTEHRPQAEPDGGGSNPDHDYDDELAKQVHLIDFGLGAIQPRIG